ncbi:hypothetical protein JCM3765_006263 [Sporobolomyces pararoseus]
MMDPTEILFELTHLPAGTNPFQWLNDFLNTRYLPHYSKSATLQLYFNIAMLEICILLVIAGLYLRYRKNHFWLFRKQLSGTLIQPNISVVGSIAGLIFMILTNVLMFSIVQASKGKLPPDLGFLTLLDTVFPGLVGELVIWSMASSYLGHLHSIQSTDRPLENWIKACNILGIATPIVHLAAFLPFDVIAGRRYAQVVVLFREIDDWLLIEAQNWSPDVTFNLTDLMPAVPLFEKLQAQILSLEPIMRTVYVFHSVTMVLIIVIVAVISTFYLASVKRLIRVAKQNLLVSERGTELLDQVYQTWAGLLVSIILTDLIASTYFALVLYSAIYPLQVSQNYILAVFWTNSILGLTSTGLMFWLSMILKPISREEKEQETRDPRAGDPLRMAGVRHRMSQQYGTEGTRPGGILQSVTATTRIQVDSEHPELLSVMDTLPRTPSTDYSSNIDSRQEEKTETMYEVKLED